MKTPTHLPSSVILCFRRSSENRTWSMSPWYERVACFTSLAAAFPFIALALFTRGGMPEECIVKCERNVDEVFRLRRRALACMKERECDCCSGLHTGQGKAA